MLSKYIFKFTPNCPGAHYTNMKLTLILAWISDYIHYKLCDEITYPFPKVWELNNSFSHTLLGVSLLIHTLLGAYLFIHAGIKVNPC